MDLNVIVTCYDRENYWPFLKKIFSSFKKINPVIALCYNGNRRDFPAQFRIGNFGKEQGDFDLISGGYSMLCGNGVNRWMKICVDSWPTNEPKLFEILYQMEAMKCHFSGFRWDHNGEIATDIFFADSMFMKRFSSGKLSTKIEKHAQHVVSECGNHIILPGRGKYARESPGRWAAPDIGFTMSHELKDNYAFAKKAGVI